MKAIRIRDLCSVHIVFLNVLVTLFIIVIVGPCI